MQAGTFRIFSGALPVVQTDASIARPGKARCMSLPVHCKLKSIAAAKMAAWTQIIQHVHQNNMPQEVPNPIGKPAPGKTAIDISLPGPLYAASSMLTLHVRTLGVPAQNTAFAAKQVNLCYNL